jgi:hypothetical protein
MTRLVIMLGGVFNCSYDNFKIFGSKNGREIEFGGPKLMASRFFDT